MIERGYNVSEAAQLLGVTARTIRYWISIGRMKANRIPGSTRLIVMESEIKRLQGNDNED